jgi:hypothetical protein
MPFGTVKKKREATIILRILPEEKTAIAGEAGKAGLTVSEYIRRRALGKPVKSRMSEKVINELRRLGGLQKHLATKYQHKKEAIDEVLVEIKAAIQRIDMDSEEETVAGAKG